MTPLAYAVCESVLTFPDQLVCEDKSLYVITDCIENGSTGECAGPSSLVGQECGEFDEGSWQQKVCDVIASADICWIHFPCLYPFTPEYASADDDPIGRCDFDDGCIDTTQAACEDEELGGQYQGDGTHCTYCRDGACDGPDEDPCNCTWDCGEPAPNEVPGSTCDDGIDNNCDGYIDCADSDCNDDPACQLPPDWYIDDDAPPGGDGTCWETAYKYLQDALAVATSGDEIRVACGRYTPDQDEAGNVTPGERIETFQLITGVSLFGGYRGCPGRNCGGGNPDERDIEVYETVLSGDLAGDDGDVADRANLSAASTQAENSYHVVTSSGTDETAILDGFAITGGNANGPEADGHDLGGGMFNDVGSPTLATCTFSGNHASSGGCGIYNFSRSSTFTDCTFTGNSNTVALTSGGGIYNSIIAGPTEAPTVTNCIVWQNTDNGGMNESAQIHIDSGTVAINHTCVQG